MALASGAKRGFKGTVAALLGERGYASIRKVLGREQPEFEPKISTVDIGGRQARFYSATLLAEKRARDILIKEPGTVEWLDQLRADDVLWDIGANIGVYSIYAAIMRKCRVVAFEPVAANYYLLNRNIELNELDGLITGYCLALADRAGFETLFIPKTTPAASAASYGQQVLPKLRHRQGCIGATIDELTSAMPFPTFVKIDVDGLEPQIIAGAVRTFSDPRLQSVLVELTLENCASAVNSLAAFGLAPRKGDDVFPEGKRVKNVIFTRGAG